jgi:hypothetical protein
MFFLVIIIVTSSSLGLTLLLASITLYVGLILANALRTAWWGLLFCLIIVGGVLVLFLYVRSFHSSQTTYLSFSQGSFMIGMWAGLLYFCPFLVFRSTHPSTVSPALISLYTEGYVCIRLTLLIYLLLRLIRIVKTIGSPGGRLRERCIFMGG